MEFLSEIPRGHLSTVILSCLVDGDKYGYEIIAEIDKKSRGKIIIKQPSLYSSLNRMEDQGLISSYWMDSEIGGRRHYYRLTDYGRKQVQKWIDELEKTSTMTSSTGNTLTEEKKSEMSNNDEIKKPIFLEQESLFKGQTETVSTNQDVVKTDNEKSNIQRNDAFIQYSLFETPQTIAKTGFEEVRVFTHERDEENKKDMVEPKKDDAVLLSRNENTQNENKKLFDKKEEFNVYSALEDLRGPSKSFSSFFSKKPDNVTTQENYKEKTLSDFMGESFIVDKIESKIEIQSFEKPTSIERINDQTTIDNSSLIESQIYSDQTASIAKPVDEGRFITETADDLLKTKRIEPPALNVEFVPNPKFESVRQNIAPAPNYKDAIAKLYEKSIHEPSLSLLDENAEKNIAVQSFSGLEKSFKEENIFFRAYDHTKKQNTSETGLINAFRFHAVKFSVCLVALILLSALTFVALKFTSGVENKLVWLYFMPSVIYLVVGGYSLFKQSRDKDKMILRMESDRFKLMTKLIFFIISSIIIYLLNLCFGLNGTNFASYSTTLLLPIIVFSMFPLSTLFSYFIKKSHYVL